MRKKVYVISFVFFIIDLLSKVLVLSIKKFPITIIKDFFYINKTFNTGAAFSLFTGNNFVFIIIAIAVLIYIDRKVICDIKNKISIISISMLIGGIIGNLFDRIAYGKVIDFLSFKFGLYNFPVFNLADTFICIGIFLLIIEFLRGDFNGNKS